MRGLFRSSTLSTMLFFPVITSYRKLNTTIICSAVDKGLLSKLRKQTGIPFINCKKALEKFDNDFDLAKKWLQEQAQKEGWARATKLQTRPMSQGLVALLGDQSQATLLEVNCETDFVARNENFIEMVSKLVQECNNNFTKQADRKVTLNRESLEALTSSEQMPLADLVALNVGNLGENMALRRAAFLRTSDTDSILCSYVHPSTSSTKSQSLQLGKYGAVVEIQRITADDDSTMDIKELGSHLCQHIVGMNPKSVGEYQNQPETGKERETANRRASHESSDSESESGSEMTQTEQEKEVEEDKLLSQQFLLDSSLTVGELLHMNGVEVKDFVRFACGEELESEKE